jgi:hypothetical protein
MKLHEGLNLDPAQVRHRERAAQWIAAMRADLAALEQFVANADAEMLKGNYWLEVLQEAELATKRALRTATHDGQSTINPREFCDKA